MCQTNQPEKIIQIVRSKDISLIEACAEKGTTSCEGTCLKTEPKNQESK